MATSVVEYASAPTGHQPAKLRHIPELDGVRGLATLIVVTYHVTVSEFHPVSLAAWNAPVRLLHSVFMWGYSGVDLFFVLSGFLITSILLEQKNSKRYYQDFYWKRVLRILPLYLLVLAGVGLFLHQYGYVLLATFFLANFATVFHVEAQGPYWSLSVEEQFYLLWPILVRRVQLKWLVRWLIAVGLASMVLRFVFAGFGHHNHYLSFLRCDGLAFGAVLACFYWRAGQKLARRPASIVLSASLLLGVAVASATSLTHSKAFFAATAVMGITLVCGGLIGLVIVHSGARVLRPLRSRFLVFFGLISYAIYMLHAYVIWTWDRYRPLADGDHAEYWFRLASCLSITIALAVLSRYVVELPAMRLRRHVLSHPTGRKAETGTAQLPLARMD